MYAATNLCNLRQHKQSKYKEYVEPPVKKNESEVKLDDGTEVKYIEPIETPVTKEDCVLEPKIDIDEDMMSKTESADLPEFIQETNDDSVHVMTGHVDDDESRRKEEQEFSNEVTIEEFLPHLSGYQDYTFY